MIKRLIGHSLSLAALTAITAFGFSGVGHAANYSAFISHTGPWPMDELTFADATSCEFTNSTVGNTTVPAAPHVPIGDGTASSDTSGSGWGLWDPVAWQNQGYSYEQWSVAFHEYLAGNLGDWQAEWGALSGLGSATSGDAGKVNTVGFDRDMGNAGCGGFGGHQPDTFGNPGAAVSSGGGVLGILSNGGDTN